MTFWNVNCRPCLVLFYWGAAITLQHHRSNYNNWVNNRWSLRHQERTGFLIQVSFFLLLEMSPTHAQIMSAMFAANPWFWVIFLTCRVMPVFLTPGVVALHHDVNLWSHVESQNAAAELRPHFLIVKYLQYTRTHTKQGQPAIALFPSYCQLTFMVDQCAPLQVLVVFLYFFFFLLFAIRTFLRKTVSMAT